MNERREKKGKEKRGAEMGSGPVDPSASLLSPGTLSWPQLQSRMIISL